MGKRGRGPQAKYGRCCAATPGLSIEAVESYQTYTGELSPKSHDPLRRRNAKHSESESHTVASMA